MTVAFMAQSVPAGPAARAVEPTVESDRDQASRHASGK